MSEEQLSVKAREALRYIRNAIMHSGKAPSVRDLMNGMSYKSPRSATLLLSELEAAGFLERKEDGGYRMLKDLKSEYAIQTVQVPLVGTVTCGAPILAQENIEALVQVSIALAKPGNKYFMLKAKGDSMNAAGINDGDLILVKQQPTAENGQQVVALIDDEATVKEFRYSGNLVTLLPRSSNKKHQPIILTDDLVIQGVVVATIPNHEELTSN